jgi:hypothetical protein
MAFDAVDFLGALLGLVHARTAACAGLRLSRFLYRVAEMVASSVGS